MNPTYPNNTKEEITLLFFKAIGEKTKEANIKTTPTETIYSMSLKFSLFDYLGIDEVTR